MNSIIQYAAYKFYTNQKVGAQLLNFTYYTEDELKEEIKSSFNIFFLEFYKNIFQNNNEIIKLIEDRLNYIAKYSSFNYVIK